MSHLPSSGNSEITPLNSNTPLKQYSKAAVVVLGLFYCCYYISTSNSSTYHFIDSVNLLIHEAGHLVFAPFGELLMLLGGSLLQTLIPLIFAGYFGFIKRQLFAAGIMLFWICINLINVSVYAGDAIKQQLPLLTGDPDTHDWNQILIMLGWLRHTATISHMIFGAGIITLGVATALSLYGSFSNENNTDLV